MGIISKSKSDYKKTKKPRWVSSDKVMKLAKQNHILCVLGAWSNGKSYACKNGVVRECWKNKTRFAFVRRNDLENKDSIIENYFLDCNVEDITDGEFNGIICYRKDIFLAKYDPDTEKWKKGYLIGHGFSLSAYAHTKSGVYQNYEYMLFEEFITTGQYLSGEFSEPYRLMRLMSTVFRNNDGHVILVGNTITPLCPYMREWSLNLKGLEQGQTRTFEFSNSYGNVTKICVYLTEPTDKKSNMFFMHEKEIHGGAFHSAEHDHVNGDIANANVIYTAVFSYENKMFLGRFVELNGAHFWYIEPKTSEIKPNTRTFGDLRIQSDLHTKGITPIHPNEKTVIDYLNAGKIRYSDNLTGTLFIQVYNKLRMYNTRFS